MKFKYDEKYECTNLGALGDLPNDCLDKLVGADSSLGVVLRQAAALELVTLQSVVLNSITTYVNSKTCESHSVFKFGSVIHHIEFQEVELEEGTACVLTTEEVSEAAPVDDASY